MFECVTNTAVLGYDLYKIITTLPRIQEKYLIEGIGEYTEILERTFLIQFIHLLEERRLM